MLRTLKVQYEAALSAITSGTVKHAVVIGDNGILPADCSSLLTASFGKLAISAFIGADASHPLSDVAKITVGSRSILERSGILVNRGLRVQYTDKVLEPIANTIAPWQLLSDLFKIFAVSMPAWNTDREVTLWYLSEEQKLAGQSIKSIKESSLTLAGGVS